MKTLLALLLLAVTLTPVAAAPDDYSVSVHVAAVHWTTYPSITQGSTPALKLDATIAGKKCELLGDAFDRSKAGVTLLVPGDYKAKLIKDEHKAPYLSLQTYEFQFPDKKTMKFYVVGVSE